MRGDSDVTWGDQDGADAKMKSFVTEEKSNQDIQSRGKNMFSVVEHEVSFVLRVEVALGVYLAVVGTLGCLMALVLSWTPSYRYSALPFHAFTVASGICGLPLCGFVAVDMWQHQGGTLGDWIVVSAAAVVCLFAIFKSRSWHEIG